MGDEDEAQGSQAMEEDEPDEGKDKPEREEPNEGEKSKKRVLTQEEKAVRNCHQ